jgi:phage-related tail fiber protein
MIHNPDNRKFISQEAAEAAIAVVDASDLARARAAVNQGVLSAKEQWIPTHLVICALALELQNQISDSEPCAELSAYLHLLANFVSADAPETGRH